MRGSEQWPGGDTKESLKQCWAPTGFCLRWLLQKSEENQSHFRQKSLRIQKLENKNDYTLCLDKFIVYNFHIPYIYTISSTLPSVSVVSLISTKSSSTDKVQRGWYPTSPWVEGGAESKIHVPLKIKENNKIPPPFYHVVLLKKRMWAPAKSYWDWKVHSGRPSQVHTFSLERIIASNEHSPPGSAYPLLPKLTPPFLRP